MPSPEGSERLIPGTRSLQLQSIQDHVFPDEEEDVRWIVVGIILAWLTVLGAAQVPWLRWESKPGADGPSLAAWPGDSDIPRPAGAPLTAMFVHPKCPCTVASLRMLEQLANSRKDLRFVVVAWRPKGSGWRPETTLSIFLDEGGVETRRFGVTTSGHVMAFGGDGAVLFSGGLTDQRAATEAGRGVDLLKAALSGIGEAHKTIPVFGCSLGVRKPAQVPERP
jgi:hypothetical protein